MDEEPKSITNRQIKDVLTGDHLTNMKPKMENKKGLTEKEAERRLKKYGKNKITKTHKINPWKILISQFTSPLIALLIAVAIISWAIGFLPGEESKIIDTFLILLIVFISGISGFFQEYKSEKAIEELQKMAVPKARVIREGKDRIINAEDIVEGDLIVLEEGEMIPADAKVIKSFGLMVDESALTGESKPVRKDTSDYVFMNTFVNTGSARAFVTKTGMQTKIGNIAGKLQSIKEEKTPFQKELSILSKKVFWTILAVAFLLFFIGLSKYGMYHSLLLSVSLAVAAIPEGLPAVIALTLSIGAKTMARKNALIRKLSVTESIGAIDIICTDKTGTLTKNEMNVTKLFLNNTEIDADELCKNKTKAPEKNFREIRRMFLCGALCNNSEIVYDEGKNRKYTGDPTEIAIRKMSEKCGMEKEKLEKEYKRISEIPFTPKRKMMSVICKRESEYFIFSKGAAEVLLEKCSEIYIKGKAVKITSSIKKQILEKNTEFASKELRVLGFAYRHLKNPKEVRELKNMEKDIEKNLVWIGLEAMTDPPRKEVKKAIKECRNAGIRVIMLTGDNPLTASAIAREIGLKSKKVITGKELDKMEDGKLKEELHSGTNIFARISPFHKLRVLEILQKNNRVAMTGDGINDSLALKKADVGIAMGIMGTEVAKEASHMILLDDNFDTIRIAVKEGRRIFDNIRKFINYLFVSNLAEVGVLLFATLFLTLKEPVLLPIHLLWINLLTDGFPALALGVDPAKQDIMRKPPRKKDEPIIDRKLGWMIWLIGIKKMIILLATFFIVLPLGFEKARTVLFTGFILYEFVRIGSIRHQEKLSWMSNKWLLSALLFSLFLQLAIIYSPLNGFFHIAPLGMYEWVVLFFGIAVGYSTAIMITKAVMKYVKD